VAGATYPAEAAQLRSVLPHSLFLVPGYGAQGASVKDALTPFVPGPNGREGGMVNSSRAILFGSGPRMSSSAEWRRGLSERLEAACAELAQGVLAAPG
jgi:orotidine-5'-phosphate decarboxylase